MDIFIYQVKRETPDYVKLLYVDSWELALQVMSKLDGTDESVSITRIKLINKFE